MKDKMNIIIVAGMLAAGKSIALTFFQDRSYYCVDNLPPALIETFLELIEKSEPDIMNVAIVLDARGGEFFDDIGQTLDNLKSKRNAHILFVDASDDVLISRYKQNRRKHLVSGNERIEVAIKKERKTMQEVVNRADVVIDTSKLKDKDFENILYDRYYKEKDNDKFSINVTSFGFKYGILQDADIVYDARFLPNPFYIKELKVKTGKDKDVSDYVFSHEEADIFVEKIMDFLKFSIPYYEKEGKAKLIIGIGCTGGRHRSVAITEQINQRLNSMGYSAEADHRDIHKDSYVY